MLLPALHAPDFLSSTRNGIYKTLFLGGSPMLITSEYVSDGGGLLYHLKQFLTSNLTTHVSTFEDVLCEVTFLLM